MTFSTSVSRGPRVLKDHRKAVIQTKVEYDYVNERGERRSWDTWVLHYAVFGSFSKAEWVNTRAPATSARVVDMYCTGSTF